MNTRGQPLPRRALARRGRLLPAALIALVTLTGSGCATFLPGANSAPNGLTRPDADLRGLLARGAYDSAFVRVRADDEVAPDDELLRAMYDGIVGYYAGAYDSSLAALDRAEQLAQDRITISTSRNLLSTVTNDRVLPYEPGPSERMLLHYYGIMAGLQSGDAQAAAVEARRLSHILDQVEEDADAGDVEGARLRGLLHYVAGVAFEAAGDQNGADVSYRRATRAAPDLAPPEPDGAPAGSGELVVVLEQGFVAHLAEETVWVLLNPDEVDLFSAGDAAEKVALAGLVAAQVASELVARSSDAYRREHSRGRDTWRDRRGGHSSDPFTGRRVYYEDRDFDHDDGDVPYLLEVAWPVLRDEPDGLLGEPLIVAGPGARGAVAAVADEPGLTQPVAYTADVSDAFRTDYASGRAAVLGRTILRAVSRFAISKAAEKKASEKNEAVGKIVGGLFNLGSVALERADTRSWHLLPGRIGIARLRLPEGEHAVSVRANGREIMLGTADVRAGRVSVLTTRMW